MLKSSNRRHDDVDDLTAGDRAGHKKAWDPPRILAREPLEMVAAACVPSPPGKPDAIQCTNPTS